MLVLQPRTCTEMDGPLIVKVDAIVGKTPGVFVGIAVEVGIAVAMFGVAEAFVTPMMRGVAVIMAGVGVDGRKGVGGLAGG